MKKSKSPKSAAGENTHDKSDDFLVVGIGASAGGIKALKELFAAMPADSGMAFVVILHLSQQYESNLAAILQRETEMTVEQVRETVKVEPNKVYVIPPAKHLEMVDGVIRLKEPERIKGIRVPIDRFFRSMAEAYGRKAVCIILSGTGTDGTLGMKHVKGKDGFAIVQDPLDAEYDGMPRSAIETKIADVILPVAEMPEKLLFVRDSSERFRLTNGNDGEVAKEIKNIELLRDVLTLLRVRTGHDFSNYKRPTLIRRVARHLQIHETDDLKEYLEILREKPDEVLSLLKNLLINVTNFFRDKEAFNTLEKKVIPAIFEGKTSEDQVRVWIAGTASGEEAYSIAILLSEYAATLPHPPKIQVFASDVDDEAIAEAREGRFTEAVVSDVSPERLRLYFVKEDDGYRIRKSIREMILFAPHNILRDPPFSRLDLISCRNVLIYLNRDTQEKILQVFHFALRDNGYLFLGASESAEGMTNIFSAMDKKHRIYQSRPTSLPWNAPPPLPVQGVWAAKIPELPQHTRRNLQSFGELHHRLIEYYAPPSILVNEEGDILHLSESAGKFLHFVGGEPTANLLKVIHPALLSDIRAALFAARQESRTVESKNIRVRFNGDEKFINLIVRPVKTPEAAALVIFEEAETEPQSKESVQAIVAGDEAMESVVRQMESDIQRTKDQLRNTIEQYETTVEELKASNEELQAMNEELRSATEELETGKEELQSVNEELTTVNHELKEKVEEVSRANSDLQNLMQSTDIATIFLDRALHVKRFTPRTRELFNIIPGDIGRPLEHITHRLAPDDFQKDAAKVLQNLQTFDSEVHSLDGRFYIARFSPYRTLEDKIDGVVLTFIDITERKRAEELLRKSEEHLELLSNSVPALIFYLDLERRYVSVNDAFTDWFGVSREAVVGLTVREFVGEEAWKLIKPHLERAYAGETIDYEVELPYAQGKRWVRPIYTPHRDALGNVIGVIVLVTDITERKRTEANLAFLADISQFLTVPAGEREIIETSAAKIGEYFAVAQCLFVKYDERAENADVVFNWRRDGKPSEIIGKHQLKDLVAPDIQAALAAGKPVFTHDIASDARVHNKKFQQQFDIAAALNTPFVNEGRLKASISIHSAAPRQWREDEIELLHELTRRIWTRIERARAEEGLRESEERLRLLIESASDHAIFTLTHGGIINSWNTGAEKVFGWTETEAVGQSFEIIFTPEDREAGVAKQEIKTALKKGHAPDERIQIRKDGSRFYVSGVMTLLKDAAGNVQGFAKIARDMTERLEAEKALHDKVILQKMVGAQELERRRIARDLHDEIGQKLVVLRLKLEHIKSNCGQTEIFDELEEIQTFIRQIDEDIDFLAWELRPAALDHLGLLSTLENYIGEWSRHAGIRTDFQARNLEAMRLAPEIEINLYRIAQEALNNINKHAKATHVEVYLEKRGDTIVLIIEDNGKGFNIKSKQTRNKGLGLTGMRERAALVGGSLEIESSRKRGTTVFVRVPARFTSPEEER